MLLTITTTRAPATDLGFLLAKNPSRASLTSTLSSGSAILPGSPYRMPTTSLPRRSPSEVRNPIETTCRPSKTWNRPAIGISKEAIATTAGTEV